jgi:D-alanyl-D-alanine endopeptidase (penicillin-binding protein 7)
MKKILCFVLYFFVSIGVSAITVYAHNITKDISIVDSEIYDVKPIASITKLMTAIVIMESGLPLDEKVTYRGMFFSSKKFTREELLNLLLVKSDNKAADALADSNHGKAWFVYQMNRKAEMLGMVNTKFDDPSGLSPKNVSNAVELVTLLNYAYNNEKIRQIASLREYDLHVYDKKNRERLIEVNSTNKNLLSKFDVIEMSKTGTTSLAGKCVVMIVHKREDIFAIVVLGGKTRNDVDNLVKNIINLL